MQAIANPVALELSKEVKKTVAPNEFARETLDRRGELLELQEYINKEKQKVKEDMIIKAIQNGFPTEIIETMREQAEITDTRLAELKNRIQSA